MVISAMKLKKKKLTPWKESYDQPRWQMVMITLYAKQKKRHRCIEQTFLQSSRNEHISIHTSVLAYKIHLDF